MTKRLVFIVTALLAVFSCCKENITPLIIEDNFFISVSLPSSKSEFADSTSNVLVWCDYDNIGLYSFSDKEVQICNDVAQISSHVGGDAIFTSSKPVSSWINGQWGIKPSEIHFFAYSPELTSNTKQTYGGGFIDFSVPNVQEDGEFGKYHFCVANGYINRNDIMSGKRVHLNFSPVTAMISVRPYLGDDTSVDSVKIAKLTVYSDNITLAGDFSYRLHDGGVSLIKTFNSIDVPLTSKYIKKSAKNNDYINVVILPTNSDKRLINFDIEMEDGSHYRFVREAPNMFARGGRYKIDREITVE